jgi:hypothetical protein
MLSAIGRTGLETLKAVVTGVSDLEAFLSADNPNHEARRHRPETDRGGSRWRDT